MGRIATPFEIQTIKENSYFNVFINSPQVKSLFRLVRMALENQMRQENELNKSMSRLTDANESNALFSTMKLFKGKFISEEMKIDSAKKRDSGFLKSLLTFNNNQRSATPETGHYLNQIEEEKSEFEERDRYSTTKENMSSSNPMHNMAESKSLSQTNMNGIPNIDAATGFNNSLYQSQNDRGKSFQAEDRNKDASTGSPTFTDSHGESHKMVFPDRMIKMKSAKELGCGGTKSFSSVRNKEDRNNSYHSNRPSQIDTNIEREDSKVMLSRSDNAISPHANLIEQFKGMYVQNTRMINYEEIQSHVDEHLKYLEQ